MLSPSMLTNTETCQLGASSTYFYQAVNSEYIPREGYIPNASLVADCECTAAPPRYHAFETFTHSAGSASMPRKT